MPSRQPFTQLCRHLATLRATGRRADLHVHTTHSDGAFTPAEVVARARQRGLAAVAVTDHDTVAGHAPAVAALAGGPPLDVIPGVEITCEHRGRELHLLGYFFRPDDPPLTAALEFLQAGRVDRFHAMVERLPDGVRPDPTAVGTCLAAGGAPGRRSLAALLVRRGAVQSVGEAFGRFLRDGGPACVPKRRLPVADAIALVRGAGGVSSWAHPPADATLDAVLELRNLGLAALEAVYPTFKAARTRRLREFAQAAGLAVTGGSDCHGPTPAARAIGSAGVGPDELAALRRAAGQ